MPERDEQVGRGKVSRRAMIVCLALGVVVVAASAGTVGWMIRGYLAQDDGAVVVPDIAGDAPMKAGGPAEAARAVIGGVVRDSHGNPVGSAVVSIQWIGSGGRGGPGRAGRGRGPTVVTDPQGHWSYRGTPVGAVDSVRLTVTRDGFLPLTQAAPPVKALLDQGALLVLTHYVDVTGQVVDEQDQPVPGASLTTAQQWTATAAAIKADTTGNFILPGQVPGTNLTLTALAPGYAPGLATVTADSSAAPIHVVLRKGRTLSGTVRDTFGTPIYGAVLVLRDWRGFTSINLTALTDEAGHYVIHNAPSDQLTLGVSDVGYTSDTLLFAPGRTQANVTLTQEPQIFGRVIDAVTRQPVPEFTITTGARRGPYQQPMFDAATARDFQAGRYDMTLGGFDGVVDGWFVRIEAKGYLPGTFGPVLLSGGHDFALRRGGADLIGRVLASDGSPAAQMSMILIRPGQAVALAGGVPARRQTAFVTGPDGKFDLPQQTGEYLVAAIGAAGYALADQDNLAKGATLSLTRWGRIDGRLLMDGQPGAGRDVYVGIGSGMTGDANTPRLYFSARTDDDGRFTILRAPTGDLVIGRAADSNAASPAASLKLIDIQSLTIAPGGVATVTIGR
jgi:hypothetical protein